MILRSKEESFSSSTRCERGSSFERFLMMTLFLLMNILAELTSRFEFNFILPSFIVLKSFDFGGVTTDSLGAELSSSNVIKRLLRMDTISGLFI